jgi:hypothetical protein
LQSAVELVADLWSVVAVELVDIFQRLKTSHSEQPLL